MRKRIATYVPSDAGNPEMCSFGAVQSGHNTLHKSCPGRDSEHCGLWTFYSIFLDVHKSEIKTRV